MNVDIGGTPKGPLAGVKVVDLSAVVSGPLCTQILGDLGADVVKIETPSGDITRLMGPPFKGGMSGFFAQFNRNKRSVSIDLKKTEGQEIVRALTRTADVFVENYRPGVVDKLGLGYAALAVENPTLIYVSINGFGADGPYAGHPAYDTVIQGLAGFMPVQGYGGTPQLIRSIIADKASAMTATYATMAALFARERGDGRGQHVAVPMLDAYAAFILPDVFNVETFVPKEGPELPFDTASVHRTWETCDGHVVLMIIEDRQFQALCRVLEREDMIDDPRCSNLLARIMNLPDLMQTLETELKKWTSAELIARAREHGCPLAPVHGIAEFLQDPQVVANRVVFESKDDTLGRTRLLRNPVRFQNAPASYRRRPPQLGEHTDEVLREAGYDAERIAELRSKQVIGGQ